MQAAMVREWWEKRGEMMAGAFDTMTSLEVPEVDRSLMLTCLSCSFLAAWQSVQGRKVEVYPRKIGRR